MSIVLARNGLALFFLVLGAVFTASAQVGPSTVQSARVENIRIVAEKARINVDIRNTGEHPITAFMLETYELNANGQRVSCGGRGADMIDWSDPMPGRGLYVRMRRNWIPPNGTLTFDVYPRCPHGTTPLESVGVEPRLIMFEDGTGEGDPHQMEFMLRGRQQMRNERLKWMDRFTALRNAPDLKSSSQELYQGLVDATYAVEISPEQALRQGMAKPVRDELQRLALDITQWAARNQSLQTNELLMWRITDLEQRTARLVRGAGTVDVNPF